MTPPATEPGVLAGEHVILRPVVASDRDRLAAILDTPEVRRWWGEPDIPEGWPVEDDPDAERFAVVVDDQVIGMVQFAEEDDPMYRHAGIDIFLDPVVHGRGHGRDAVRTLARFLIQVRGHHRLVIDPAAANHRAISTYAAVGFRTIGVMRCYERNADGTGWHDGLLMDLLAPELT